jgi:hypothetical protein
MGRGVDLEPISIPTFGGSRAMSISPARPKMPATHPLCEKLWMSTVGPGRRVHPPAPKALSCPEC